MQTRKTIAGPAGSIITTSTFSDPTPTVIQLDSRLEKIEQRDINVITDLNFYVETDGNDKSGDGTITKPFKTIRRAISAIPDNTLGVSYILLGSGSFEWNEAAQNAWYNLRNNTNIRFIGVMEEVETGLSITPSSDGDTTKFTVQQNDSDITWDENIYNDGYCLGYSTTTFLTGMFYPIMAHSGSTVETMRMNTNITGNVDTLYKFATTLTWNVSATNNTMFKTNGPGGVSITALYNIYIDQYNPDSVYVSIGQLAEAVNFYSCILKSNDTTRDSFSINSKSKALGRTLVICQLPDGPNAIMALSVTGERGTFDLGVRYDGPGWPSYDPAFKTYDIIQDNVTSIFIMNAARGFELDDANGVCTFGGNNSLAYGKDILKFKNCGVGVYESGPSKLVLNEFCLIVFDNTHYFMHYPVQSPDHSISIPQGIFLGAPLERTLVELKSPISYTTNPYITGSQAVGMSAKPTSYNADYYFVSEHKNSNINLSWPGLYKEHDPHFHAILSDNGTTDVVVGDTDQSLGIIIDYTIERGNTYSMNTIKMLNKSGSLVFNEGTALGDDVGCTFTGSISGSNEIVLESTLTNTGDDATLKAHVRRTFVADIFRRTT